MKRLSTLALIGLCVLVNVKSAWACDLCAFYSSLASRKPQSNTFRLGMAEQFTYQGTVQENGKYSPNNDGQHLASSVTQLYAAYDLNDWLGVQLNLPYLSRHYKRVTEDGIEKGSESGLGDLALIAKYTLFETRQPTDALVVQLFAGIKLPSGDSDRLGEEKSEGAGHDHETEDHETEEEDHEDAHQHAHYRHAGHDHNTGKLSAVHGHDLALGSGSVDFPVGLSVFAERGRAFVLGDLQYTFRNEGDFDYEHADDLLWRVSPAYYLIFSDSINLALAANLSGEYKRDDKFEGSKSSGTSVRTLFLGPEVIVQASQLSAELGIDLPLDINNSGVQTVADYRIRAAISYYF